MSVPVSPIEQLEATGSHFEVGFAIGKRFAEQIQNIYRSPRAGAKEVHRVRHIAVCQPSSLRDVGARYVADVYLYAMRACVVVGRPGITPPIFYANSPNCKLPQTTDSLGTCLEESWC